MIGAGPAGVAAALQLTRDLSIECTLYEIRSRPTTLGGAINIPSNGLRLFQRMGLYEALIERGSLSANLILHSTRDGVLVDIDMAASSRKKTGFGFMRIMRTDLMEVLLSAVKHCNITINYSKRLVAIAENNEGVNVSFSDGTTDTADLLLGCDGIHSTVRRLYVDPGMEPEYSGISNMFSILPTPSNFHLNPGLHATLTQSGLFVVMPCTVKGDQLYWFLSREVPVPDGGESRDGWEAYGKAETEGFKSHTMEVLKDVEGEWGKNIRHLVNQTDAVQFYPIYRLPQGGRWSTGRCLLLGDAAHAIQPHAGQGVSMALEDIFLLSRLLREEGRSLDETYRRYEEIRRPRIDGIWKTSVRNGEVRKRIGPWVLRARELVIGFGFWLYKAAGLDKWNVGVGDHDWIYDIEDEAI